MKTQEKSEGLKAAESLLHELENHRDSLKILLHRTEAKEVPIVPRFMLLTHIVLFLNNTKSQMDMVTSIIKACNELESEDKT